MVPKQGAELSDELPALFSRAELASADARRLLDENERWRQRVQWQLDYMFELSAEFWKAWPIISPRILQDGFVVPGRPLAPRSGRGAVPIP